MGFELRLVWQKDVSKKTASGATLRWRSCEAGLKFPGFEEHVQTAPGQKPQPRYLDVCDHRSTLKYTGKQLKLQQFPETRKTQCPSGIPTYLFVNIYAKMRLSSH